MSIESYPRIRYDAGDHVAIYPQNDTELVEKIGKLLELDLDTVFTMINLASLVIDLDKKFGFKLCDLNHRTRIQRSGTRSPARRRTARRSPTT